MCGKLDVRIEEGLGYDSSFPPTSAGKPILATRLPNTTGGTPPGLKGSLLAQFTPSSINAAIDAAFPPKPSLF
jgi:hypothetical protein